MAKVLKVHYPQKCIGCELCILALQRQLGKVGLEGSLIRVTKNLSADGQSMEYVINLDTQVNNYAIQEIADVCPTGVFTIEEKEDELFS